MTKVVRELVFSINGAKPKSIAFAKPGEEIQLVFNASKPGDFILEDADGNKVKFFFLEVKPAFKPARREKSN